MPIVKGSIRYAALTLIVIVFFFPIYWMLITTMKPQEQVLNYPPLFYPPQLTFQYYVEALGMRGAEGLANSLIVASSVTLISLVLGTFAGYGFARYRVGGFHLPFWILSTRMMPAVAAIIPLFLLFKELRLIDTYGAVILAHLIVCLPFAVWMMRGFFMELPHELEEAALIDGCSKWQAFVRIALPLTAPAIAITALFCFIFSWNEFVFALVLTRRVAITMPVVVSGLHSIKGVLWPQMTAISAMGLLPVLAIALVAQKYLVRGMTMGAIK
jgi:multiple sugar transport system permease protein